MKREARPLLSIDGQQALVRYTLLLHHLENLSPVTRRNYQSDLRQFIAGCEGPWDNRQKDRAFTPQAVAPALLVHYRDYLQMTLGLKPATINRTLMSLKYHFAWTRKAQFIQSNPASLIKFLTKEAPPLRHLEGDEEDALVAVVNGTGILQDQTIITLLPHTGLRARELRIFMRQQIYLGKRNGIVQVTGKHKKMRKVSLNTTARSILHRYLETLPQERQYLFPSEKTGKALNGRALGHLVTKYAAQAKIVDVSPHDLRHRFGYRLTEVVSLHRLAQIMGHDSLGTTMLYIRGRKQDLQQDVEKIAWM